MVCFSSSVWWRIALFAGCVALYAPVVYTQSSRHSPSRERSSLKLLQGVVRGASRAHERSVAVPEKSEVRAKMNEEQEGIFFAAHGVHSSELPTVDARERHFLKDGVIPDAVDMRFVETLFHDPSLQALLDEACDEGIPKWIKDFNSYRKTPLPKMLLFTGAYAHAALLKILLVAEFVAAYIAGEKLQNIRIYNMDSVDAFHDRLFNYTELYFFETMFVLRVLKNNTPLYTGVIRRDAMTPFFRDWVAALSSRIFLLPIPLKFDADQVYDVQVEGDLHDGVYEAFMRNIDTTGKRLVEAEVLSRPHFTSGLSNASTLGIICRKIIGGSAIADMPVQLHEAVDPYLLFAGLCYSLTRKSYMQITRMDRIRPRYGSEFASLLQRHVPYLEDVFFKNVFVPSVERHLQKPLVVNQQEVFERACHEWGVHGDGRGHTVHDLIQFLDKTASYLLAQDIDVRDSVERLRDLASKLQDVEIHVSVNTMLDFFMIEGAEDTNIFWVVLPTKRSLANAHSALVKASLEVMIDRIEGKDARSQLEALAHEVGRFSSDLPVAQQEDDVLVRGHAVSAQDQSAVTLHNASERGKQVATWKHPTGLDIKSSAQPAAGALTKAKRLARDLWDSSFF